MKPKYKKLLIRVYPEQLKIIKKYAKDNRLTVAQAVRNLIERHASN